MENGGRIIQQFFRAWGRTEGELYGAIREYLLPDAVWENVGIATTMGPEGAIAFLRKYLAAARLATFNAEIRNISCSDQIVFVERVDRGVRLDGTLLENPGIRVVGVFELKNGRIAAWRDYFDTAPHKQQGSRTST